MHVLWLGKFDLYNCLFHCDIVTIVGGIAPDVTYFDWLLAQITLSVAPELERDKLVYRLIELFLSTEIFSKRRKIYTWIEEKPEQRSLAYFTAIIDHSHSPNMGGVTCGDGRNL